MKDAYSSDNPCAPTGAQDVLPRLPTGEELELEEQSVYDLSGNWLDLTVQYPNPRFLLEYGGVGFSPLGGIQAITGQKKNGKTWLMCQLMAAVLADVGSERMEAALPGLRSRRETTEWLPGETVVLYCDTEQEIENTARVARRVHWLCGWELQRGNPRLRVLWLRSEESAAVRWGKIKQAIREVRPTAIFLDGIRDVIGDFNDNAESANLISECMSIVTRMNSCMWCVLHENPGTEKMRGHLGTELGNKVTDTFSCKKEKGTRSVRFRVQQLDARGKDVDDWTFVISDDAGALGIPHIVDASELRDPALRSADEVREWLTEGQGDIEWPATGKEVKEIFRNRGGVTRNEDLQQYLKVAENRRFILKQERKDMKQGQNFPRYVLNDGEILPF